MPKQNNLKAYGERWDRYPYTLSTLDNKKVLYFKVFSTFLSSILRSLFYLHYIFSQYVLNVGRCSSVGIATGYGLDGPGI